MSPGRTNMSGESRHIILSAKGKTRLIILFCTQNVDTSHVVVCFSCYKWLKSAKYNFNNVNDLNYLEDKRLAKMAFLYLGWPW